jgi:hypothetical protein
MPLLTQRLMLIFAALVIVLTAVAAVTLAAKMTLI